MLALERIGFAGFDKYGPSIDLDLDMVILWSNPVPPGGLSFSKEGELLLSGSTHLRQQEDSSIHPSCIYAVLQEP